ncbi:PaaI family thioesterase [Falsibacillus albus]|uniref:PaaI family thioesterase n=1 Tax=Falsibacillus albus TaxID=2478915 RepID=A0A3L7K578_9BACI|nr:PaaI family thioesterase [Falsibacillus albus]RLQ95862.1 PaaI family thioesterase [Falsibacillus albus]
MNKELQLLLEDCILHASGEDLSTIKQVLEGIRRKQIGLNGSFIGAILNMEKKMMEDGGYAVEVPINELTANSLGIVHGGITATVLDSAMGTLANILLPEGFGAVTSNLTIHYISPGIGNSMTAIARIIHKGTKTIVIEGEIIQDDGKKIAHCTGTFFVIKKPAA